MKVAIVTDWFAPRRGGIEGQLLELAERLGARGHAVDVITSTPNASGGDAFRLRQLDVVRIPVVQLAVASPTLVRSLRRELARGYEVVHAHVSVVSPVGYAAAAIARSLDLATVITFHSVLRHKRHLLRLVNMLAGLAKGDVSWTAVSELVAGQARDAFGGADVSVLPNGVDLGFWTSPSMPSPTRDGCVTLISTMRLHRKKRPLELLRAFVQAAQRARSSARLVIIGDGPERAKLERLAHDAGVEVELAGWQDREQLRALYARADGFVLASIREAFGIAALEARAAGLPVIAMAASGSNEFLRHGQDALLCRDDEDLVRQIARFIGDASLRATLAQTPVALERYDWGAVIAAHETAYQRVMKRVVSAELVAASA